MCADSNQLFEPVIRNDHSDPTFEMIIIRTPHPAALRSAAPIKARTLQSERQDPAHRASHDVIIN